MINDDEYAKNNKVISALRGIINGLRDLEWITEAGFKSLNIAIDSLYFYNKKRREYYKNFIDKFLCNICLLVFYVYYPCE